MKIRTNIILTATLVVTLCLASCSTEKNFRVLSFFFDGVPKTDTAIVTQNNIVSSVGDNSGSFDTIYTDIIPVYTLHYPYEEKECSSCHDELSPGNMTLPEPDLCYMCHEDFSSKYTFIHGPVAGGYCTACHNAHQSKNSYLLLRTGNNICSWCHDANEAPRNEMHDDIGEYECTMCHNPHGGEDKMLIR